MKCHWKPVVFSYNPLILDIRCPNCDYETTFEFLKTHPELLTRTCPASPKPMPEVPMKLSVTAGVENRREREILIGLIDCVKDLQERVK